MAMKFKIGKQTKEIEIKKPIQKIFELVYDINSSNKNEPFLNKVELIQKALISIGEEVSFNSGLSKANALYFTLNIVDMTIKTLAVHGGKWTGAPGTLDLIYSEKTNSEKFEKLDELEYPAIIGGVQSLVSMLDININSENLLELLDTTISTDSSVTPYLTKLKEDNNEKYVEYTNRYKEQFRKAVTADDFEGIYIPANEEAFDIWTNEDEEFKAEMETQMGALASRVMINEIVDMIETITGHNIEEEAKEEFKFMLMFIESVSNMAMTKMELTEALVERMATTNNVTLTESIRKKTKGLIIDLSLINKKEFESETDRVKAIVEKLTSVVGTMFMELMGDTDLEDAISKIEK